jgi:hypothetical protein
VKSIVVSFDFKCGVADQALSTNAATPDAECLVASGKTASVGDFRRTVSPADLGPCRNRSAGKARRGSQGLARLATNKYAVEIKRNVGTGERFPLRLLFVGIGHTLAKLWQEQLCPLKRLVEPLPSVILMVNSALSRRVLCVAVAILAASAPTFGVVH